MKDMHDANSKKLANGDQKGLDPTIFKFSPDIDNSPSKEIEKLLISLTLKKMELLTYDLPDPEPFFMKPHTIHSVSITGQPNYIQANLWEIHQPLVDYLQDYTDGAEGMRTKIKELAKSKWLIEQFLFQATMEWDPLESTCRHASLSIL